MGYLLIFKKFLKLNLTPQPLVLTAKPVPTFSTQSVSSECIQKIGFNGVINSFTKD